NVIDNLLEKVDYLMIGGGLAFTFIKAQGHEIGASLLEEDKLDLAKQYLKKAENNVVTLVLLEDDAVDDSFSDTADTIIVELIQIQVGWQRLDIGIKTRKTYDEIIQKSKMVIWNGPMGVFEMNPFAGGTKSVAESLAQTEGYTIIGGGDSAAAVKKF